MRNLLILSLFCLLLSTHLQAKQCPKLINNSLGLKAYRCSDGSVSFDQPASKPLKLNPFKLGAELALMKLVPRLESFPNQYREDYQPISGPSEPKKEKKESPSKSIEEILKEYTKMISIAEGKCGQTAASNVIAAYCGNRLVSPELLSKVFFHDSAPGVHPSTLTLGLNKVFKEQNLLCQQGRWNYYYSDNNIDFLDSLYKHTNKINAEWRAKSPLIVLLSTDSGESLHYVTVTNIEGYCPENATEDSEKSSCKITYNDNGSQTKTTCSNFVKKVESIQKNKLFSMVIKKYPRIVFKSSLDSE